MFRFYLVTFRRVYGQVQHLINYISLILQGYLAYLPIVTFAGFDVAIAMLIIITIANVLKQRA